MTRHPIDVEKGNDRASNMSGLVEYDHYQTNNDKQYPPSSFANAKQKLNSEKEELKKHYSFHKGTTYSIGKPGDPHYLQTVQKNDFDKKNREDSIIPGRWN